MTKNLFDDTFENSNSLNDLTAKLNLDDDFFVDDAASSPSPEFNIHDKYNVFTNSKQTKELDEIVKFNFKNIPENNKRKTPPPIPGLNKTEPPKFDATPKINQSNIKDKTSSLGKDQKHDKFEEIDNLYNDYLSNIKPNDTHQLFDQNNFNKQSENEIINTFSNFSQNKTEITKINVTKKVDADQTKVFFNDDSFDKNNNENTQNKFLSKTKKFLTENIYGLDKINEAQKKLKEKKVIYKALPQFYKSEMNYTKFCLSIAILLLLLSLGTFIVVSLDIFLSGFSKWLYLPQCLFNFSAIFLVCVNSYKLISFKKETKLNNYIISNEKTTSTIKRIYKSLCTSPILLNWISASVYIVSLLTILLTYIVTYFTNLIDNGINDFTQLVIGTSNNGPLIVVWTFASICFLTIFLQIFFNIYNRKRKNDIELFYNSSIIDDEMMEKYKKSANKKGMAIFFSSLLVIGFIVVITYLVFKRKAKKAILVK